MRKLYKLWNRTDKINGLEPKVYLSQYPFKNYNGDIILLYLKENIISQVESKEMLSQIYNIDISLPLDDFMNEYFTKSQLVETDEKIEEDNENQ